MHASRNRLAAKNILPLLLQSKEVQQHLQSHTVKNIAIVKILLSGLVIHNPEEIGAANPISIHPIHKTDELGLHIPGGHLDGGHFPIPAKAKFKVHRLKLTRAQLLPQLLHHEAQLLHITAEQIFHPLRVNLAEMLSGIGLGMLIGDFHGLLQRNLMKATLRHHIPGRFLQHRVNIGAEFRRVNLRFLPLPGPQAVLEEIGETAFRLPVNLRCGQIEPPAIELIDIFPGDPAKGVVTSGAHIPIFIQNSQLLRCGGRIQLCKKAGAVIGIRCQHRNGNRLLAAGQIPQTAEHIGRLGS